MYIYIYIIWTCAGPRGSRLGSQDARKCFIGGTTSGPASAARLYIWYLQMANGVSTSLYRVRDIDRNSPPCPPDP